MKCAIYNGFPFHFDVMGHIIEYCKLRGYSITIFSTHEGEMGWIEYYNIPFHSLESYSPKSFDFVFLLTDNDWTFPETPEEKVICIEHSPRCRREGNLHRVTFKHRTGIPFIYFNFSIPRMPKYEMLTVGCLGVNKVTQMKFPCHVIEISRHANPLDATEMCKILSQCHYLAMLFSVRPPEGTSASISMSFVYNCVLLTSQEIIDEYKLETAVNYNAIERLEIPSKEHLDRVYEEGQRYIQNRNNIYDSFITKRKIPRNLFQTFKTKKLSPEFQKVVNTWKEHNPEYNYQLYDDKDCDTFMKRFDTRIYNAYKKIIPGAFKADLWRYCVLYEYGGVYADVDTLCIGKIDDFLFDTTEFVIPVDMTSDYKLFNSFIAAAPRSKILKECINRIVCNVETGNTTCDKLDFSACGTVGIETNIFLGRNEHEPFKPGWFNSTHHLLYFEPTKQYVQDEYGNILFQNKNANTDLYTLYVKECAGTPSWFYQTEILKEPFVVFQWDHKIRLGDNGDCGYVIADNLGSYDMYISAGVGTNESFSRDFIRHFAMNEQNSFAFDGTIDKYPWEYTTDISFVRKNISVVCDANHTNLDHLLSRCKDGFLKMDIEGYEWRWLMYTKYLQNIKQIVIELHGVWSNVWCHGQCQNGLTLEYIRECFEKLAETHVMVHVHGNNHAELVNDLPNVLEVTFVRRDNIQFQRNTHKFPVNDLDYPCKPHVTDYSMNAQPFVWTLTLESASRKVYSQFGQDGIINEIFKNIGTTNKYCVEFGQNNPQFKESNTGLLRLEYGWNGLVMDSKPSDSTIQNEHITSRNIISLFRKYNVPLEPDYVSIDIDSCDIWVFKSIIQSEFKPRVVSVEYNPTFDDLSVVPDDPNFIWQHDCVYGASLKALECMGRMNGYTLVAVVYPVDCFFIRNDLLGTLPVIKDFSSKINPHFNKPSQRMDMMVQLNLETDV